MLRLRLFPRTTEYVALLCLAGTVMLLALRCGKSDDDNSDEPRSLLVKGTIFVPNDFDRLLLFQEGKLPYFVGWNWRACPATGNQSGIKGPFMQFQSATNCADQQYLSFSQAGGRDLSPFANGRLRLTLEVGNAALGIKLLMQDTSTQVSKTLDLAAYGYDRNKLSVSQEVIVPISDLTADGFKLTSVERILQLIGECSTTSCILTVKSAIFDTVPLPATGTGSGGTGVPITPGGLVDLGRAYCHGIRACRPARYAPVRFVRSTPLGWTAEPTVVGQTNADGGYTIGIDDDGIDRLTSEGKTPIAIAATDPDSGITLMSLITKLEEESNETIEIDIDLTSTITTMLDCPGGTTPPCAVPPDHPDQLESAINEFMRPGGAAGDSLGSSIEELAARMSDNDAVFAALAEFASNNGGAAPDRVSMKQTLAAGRLPVIIAPKASSKTPSGAGGSGPSDKKIAGFPANLTPGNYVISGQICVTGGAACQNIPPQNVAIDDVAHFENYFVSTIESSAQGCAGAAGSATCSVSFSPFNGTAFSVTITAQSCSEGQCATATVTYTVTHRG